jgi:hypothetical protein
MPLSTFLNGTTPTRLRGLLWLSLSDVGHHVTQVSTDDTGGGVTQVWTAGTADIACRLDPLGDNTGLVGGRVDERSTHMVTVPPGTTVNASDRFAITGRGTFEITATRDQTSEFAHSFEVIEIS